MNMRTSLTNMCRRILLIGGGGHCKSVLDTLLTTQEYSEIGIIDVGDNLGKNVCNIPVVGCDGDLEKLKGMGYTHAFIAFGGINNLPLRIKNFERIKALGFLIPNIIDPSAIVSINAMLGAGIFAGKNAVINSGAEIGDCVIINTRALVEHDCKIGDFADISPGAVICGGVEIGKNTFIGAQSAVRQTIKIGSDTLIGMGSIVVKDVPGNAIAYGNPCRVKLLI